MMASAMWVTQRQQVRCLNQLSALGRGVTPCCSAHRNVAFTTLQTQSLGPKVFSKVKPVWLGPRARAPCRYESWRCPRTASLNIGTRCVLRSVACAEWSLAAAGSVRGACALGGCCAISTSLAAAGARACPGTRDYAHRHSVSPAADTLLLSGALQWRKKRMRRLKRRRRRQRAK